MSSTWSECVCGGVTGDAMHWPKYGDQRWQYKIQCYDCGRETAWADSLEEAIALWDAGKVTIPEKPKVESWSDTGPQKANVLMGKDIHCKTYQLDEETIRKAGLKTAPDGAAYISGRRDVEAITRATEGGMRWRPREDFRRDAGSARNRRLGRGDNYKSR